MLFDVADRIRKLREQSGITQSELAKKLGITRSSVNSWEMGLSVPSTQNIVELTEIFGVSSDFILGISETAAVNVKGLTDEDILLLNQLIAHLRNKNSRTRE